MENRKDGVIDQEKYRKISSKRKCTDREYHVQYNTDVAHKDVRMYYYTNQFPELPFCAPHTKPRGARGLSKHYHLRFDPKIGYGVCAIHRIPCACVVCTSMLDKPLISGIPPKKQARYQPISKCTYWSVLGPYNNCNIIEITPKCIPFGAFDDIYQFVIDGIS